MIQIGLETTLLRDAELQRRLAAAPRDPVLQ